MNIKPNNTNFTGRYILKGKIDHVNKAAVEIKANKKDKVEFYPITSGENRIVVVATNKDAITLKKKKEEDLNAEIKKIIKDKKNFLSNLCNLIFGTNEDTLIIENDELNRFIRTVKSTNFNNGSSNSNFKSAKKFVDGTIKRYTIKGRLHQIELPDGTIEKIDADGTRTIISPDGIVLTIGSKKEIPITQQEQKQTKEIKIETTELEVQKEIINTDGTISTPYRDGIWKVSDPNGNLLSFIFPDGTRKNYDIDGNITEKIFPNGKKELFSKEGKLLVIINPDGSYEDIKPLFPETKIS